MSDTTAVQNQLKWGLATDCKTNPVCAKALKDAYGLAPTNVTYLSACKGPGRCSLSRPRHSRVFQACFNKAASR